MGRDTTHSQGTTPVSRDETGAWVLRRHADVVAAATDPETFSSRVSRHLNVPNGMDGEEHARYRALVDRYLDPAAVRALEPRFREIAAGIAGSLPAGRPVEAVTGIGGRFAVRAQSNWLGWPAELEDSLLEWVEANRAATRSRDPRRNRAVAERFDRIVRSLVEERRQAPSGAAADVTSRLMGEQIDGRPLSDEEIVSILRNWTSGDLGSIAACIGVVIHRLASDRELQGRWRRSLPEPSDLDREIDEILRIDDPFKANRRITTRAVKVGETAIPAGARVLLDWSAANRDPEVTGDPDAFRPVANAPRNLLYGIGPHACPGRALASLEIRLAIEELLAATTDLGPDPDLQATRALPPQGGFQTVPVRVRKAGLLQLEVRKGARMSDRFSVGDHVKWNSEAGHVSGRITKIHTADFDYKGHTRRASKDDPQYEIKSDKTDHVAAHKGSALKLVDD